MKLVAIILVYAAGVPGAVAAVERSAADGRAITEVVKLLQKMMEQSKQEGDTEQALYAKYKCYCDTNEKSKKAEIERLTEEIAVLGSEIDATQASSGLLSKEAEQLHQDMLDNEAAREQATNLRNKEHEDFLALEKDLSTAIGQLNESIAILAEIGADQTLNTAADHQKYMAGFEGTALLKLKSNVQQALLAANAFVGRKEVGTLQSFLQAPFTGDYSSQSGEVVGILKDMRDTFMKNLEAAMATEKQQQEAYDNYMAEMIAEYGRMKDSYGRKQDQLGGNDGDLATKRGQLADAVKAKAEAVDFLTKLLDMCAKKKAQYEERVQLRTAEEAALAEAIAILNNDAAFATFGAVDATSNPDEAVASFVQLRRATIGRHRVAKFAVVEEVRGFEAPRRRAAQEFLQKAAKTQGSSMLGRVASMLSAENPFAVVLEEIQKMIGLLAAEGQKDAEHKVWCDDERKRTNDDVLLKQAQINSLNEAINILKTAIDHPETGLKVMIKTDEDLLQTNYQNQVSETAERTQDHIAYEKDIANLVEAESLVSRAIVVLRKYYSKVSAEIAAGGVSLLQDTKDDPKPPSTWDDKYAGQTPTAVDAVSMLEFILKNTKAEETAAHNAELDAQHSYEDSMKSLKDEEATLQKQLADNRKLLAEKEEELLQRTKELETTVAEEKALQDYLVEIKPGCDFITTNIELRDNSRVNEKAALEKALDLIRGTPAFAKATAEAEQEALGDCKDICNAMTEFHVECKACLAKVTVPGYCAGHPSTNGCTPGP